MPHILSGRGWLVLGLFLIAGCGKSGISPVQGVVKLDGKPLVGASVLFIAQDPEGRDARGNTDAQGAFRLSTFQLNDGALSGHYKIVLQPAAAKVDGPPTLTAEDAQKGSNENVPRAPGVSLPARYTQPDQTVLVQDVPVKGEVVLELQSK